MPAADPATVARRVYQELWNDRRYDAAEELFDPGFRHPAVPGLSGGAAKVAAVRGYHDACPDLVLTVEELLAGPEAVAARFTVRGTDTGGLKGRPPTGRPLQAWGVEFLRVRDGRITDDWIGVDWLGILTQLGVVANPWAAA
jgi:predicted ester cyclase